MTRLSIIAFSIFAMSELSALAAPAATSLDTRSPTESKQVIAQMFEWSWDSIAAECTSFIGPAGYGFVQGIINHPKLVYFIN